MHLIRRRFYCTNVVGCDYARRDHVYDEASFRQDPTCRGTGTDGCGQRLVEGRSIDRRALLLSGIAGAAGVLWVGRQTLFPPPLEGIAFESASTRITMPDMPAQIAIVRHGDTSKAVDIRYRTEDGSAKAGLDYLPDGERIALAAGERRKMLQVKVLAIPEPGNDADKRFTVVLANVRGAPSHSVVIGPTPPTPESLTQAQTLVRALSSLAVEVAALYVKIQVAQAIIGSNSAPPDDRKYYAQRLQSLISNSEQARQRYIVLARDLCAVDQRSVAQSFKEWVEKLNQANVSQQRDATLIAQKLHARHCETKVMDIDHWARQLSQAIPRASAPSTGT